MHDLSAAFELLPTSAELLDLAKKNRYKYISATPYPHIVLDNFFPDNLLDNILEEFPQKGSKNWIKYSNKFEDKLGSRDETSWGPHTRLLLYYLNSQPFIDFLQELTGIEETLISDPFYTGGGLHQILPGGLLKIHADFNKHPQLKLDRRLNALVYLNKDWDESYGGHFEMWETDMKTCANKVLPLFNRLVVFSTTSFSYHGHPSPLTCPEGRSRRSLALYYYSNGRPQSEIVEELGEHTTLFQNRPQENFNIEQQSKRGEAFFKAKEIVKSLTPPAFLNAYRKLKHR